MAELRDPEYIRNAGWEDEDEAKCPVCGLNAEYFYKGKNGQVIGCSECVYTVDSSEIYP